MRSDFGTSGGNNLWYLVHCQPRKETYAANALSHSLKLLVFLPESQIRSHGIIERSPFFPGYIFINADLQKISKSNINACPGVLRLVEFDGSPQPVPQHVIDVISQQLSRLSESPMQFSYHFSPGDTVQVKYGPLQDLKMVFVESTAPNGRVHVLLEFLGRLKEVQISADVLEKVPAKSTVTQELRVKGERLTRGRGRRIHRDVCDSSHSALKQTG